MSQVLPVCELCGHPMPPGEEVFKYHGYSGPCPAPPMPKVEVPKTVKGQVLMVLNDMKSAGSWDAKTLTRAIEIIETIRE